MVEYYYFFAEFVNTNITITSYLVPAEANASPCTSIEIEYAPAGGVKGQTVRPEGVRVNERGWKWSWVAIFLWGFRQYFRKNR